MKLYVIIFALIFCNFLDAVNHNDPQFLNSQAKSERLPLGLKSPIEHDVRPAICITINSQPASNNKLDGNHSQQTEHASQPTTQVTPIVQQKTNHTPRNGTTVADAFNIYIAALCWPIGLLVYCMRSSSNEE